MKPTILDSDASRGQNRPMFPLTLGNSHKVWFQKLAGSPANRMYFQSCTGNLLRKNSAIKLFIWKQYQNMSGAHL